MRWPGSIIAAAALLPVVAAAAPAASEASFRQLIAPCPPGSSGRWRSSTPRCESICPTSRRHGARRICSSPTAIGGVMSIIMKPRFRSRRPQPPWVRTTSTAISGVTGTQHIFTSARGTLFGQSRADEKPTAFPRGTGRFRDCGRSVGGGLHSGPQRARDGIFSAPVEWPGHRLGTRAMTLSS